MLLSALDASGTESPDNLSVKGTKLLKDTHFCCGIRTKDNKDRGKSPFYFIGNSCREEELSQ